MPVPHHTDFVLKDRIANVPAGEAGQLKRLDSYHVALTFDNPIYPDLVFDVQDTEPEVWAAIQPHKPDKCCRGLPLSLAAALALEFPAWGLAYLTGMPVTAPAALYTVAVVLFSMLLETRGALIVAVFAALLHNLVAVEPFGQFVVPTARELAIYTCWIVIAVMVSQLRDRTATIRRILFSSTA